MSGSIEVYGDVMPGEGYEVDFDGGSATISGNTCSHSGGGDVPSVEMGDAETNNDNGSIGLTDDGNEPFISGSNLYITSQDNLTLAPGTYYFESLTFDSQSSLTLTGPTTIYLEGNFNASGKGTINTTQNPADLTIISSGTSVELSGGAEFYGSIFAPNATVTLSGAAALYGVVVGKTVEASGNFQFHVDESMALATLIKLPPPMLVK